MALPAYPNAISLSAVNVELGYTSTQLITLNDAAVRSLFVKASGAIAMSDGHGKSAALPDINSASWPGVSATYDYNGYRTMLKYHAGGAGSTTYFTLQNNATIDLLLMSARASTNGDGHDGQDTRNDENCCVCDGSDNRDKGGYGGDGGDGGRVVVVTGHGTVLGGIANTMVIGAGSASTTAFGYAASEAYSPYGIGQASYGGFGQEAACDENCDCGDNGGPGTGYQSSGYVESWTGQSLRFGQPGQGGGGGVGNCGCGQSSGVGAQGADGSGYGAGGGGGGGGTPYLPPTSGRPNPDDSTAGGAIMIRFRYRPV